MTSVAFREPFFTNGVVYWRDYRPLDFGSIPCKIELETDHPFGEDSLATLPLKTKRPAVRSDESLQLALAAARVADDNRGQDIKVIDLREVTPVFDFFVIATGSSKRQLHAMSEEIDRVFEKELGQHRLGIEGYVEGRWVLLDYGDVVIHLFDAEAREYYSLEQLWGDARQVELPATRG